MQTEKQNIDQKKKKSIIYYFNSRAPDSPSRAQSPALLGTLQSAHMEGDSCCANHCKPEKRHVSPPPICRSQPLALSRRASYSPGCFSTLAAGQESFARGTPRLSHSPHACCSGPPSQCPVPGEERLESGCRHAGLPNPSTFQPRSWLLTQLLFKKTQGQAASCRWLPLHTPAWEGSRMDPAPAPPNLHQTPGWVCFTPRWAQPTLRSSSLTARAHCWRVCRNTSLCLDLTKLPETRNCFWHSMAVGGSAQL